MRKLTIPALFVLSLLTFACSDDKDNATPDNTASITGAFQGIITTPDTSATDQNISITKISNTQVKISPASSDDLATEFVANVKDSAGAIVLTIPTQQVGNVSVSQGGTSIYEPNTKSLVYEINYKNGSDDYSESFLGAKK